VKKITQFYCHMQRFVDLLMIIKLNNRARLLAITKLELLLLYLPISSNLYNSKDSVFLQYLKINFRFLYLI